MALLLHVTTVHHNGGKVPVGIVYHSDFNIHIMFFITMSSYTYVYWSRKKSTLDVSKTLCSIVCNLLSDQKVSLNIIPLHFYHPSLKMIQIKTWSFQILYLRKHRCNVVGYAALFFLQIKSNDSSKGILVGNHAIWFFFIFFNLIWCTSKNTFA